MRTRVTWTRKENARLLLMTAGLSKPYRWKTIGKHFPGRNPASLRNHLKRLSTEGTSLSGAELFSDLCLALTPSEWKEGEEGYEHIEDALCDLERAFEDTVRALVEDP